MENNTQKQGNITHTYAEDMAHVLENEKGGLIKKIIQGEERHEIEKSNLSPESKKNRFFMLLGALLILASVGTLSFFLLKREIPSVPAPKQFTPLIFTDKSFLLEIGGLKKDDISKKVLNEINTSTIKTGGVEGIYLTFNKSPVGLRKFIEVTEATFVPNSDVNLLDDNFLIGFMDNASLLPPVVDDSVVASSISTTLSGRDFFILLKMRSIPDIFDALRTWENKMFTDLHGFLGIDITPETKYLLTKNFEDGVVENKNARVIYDKENKIVLMYIFVDDNSIIVTNSELATREIILRLASSKVKK